MNTMTDCVNTVNNYEKRIWKMRSGKRADIEQQISDIIDEVSVQDLAPSVALRQVMYCVDLYAHKQKLIGMQEIADLYQKGVRL